MTVYDWDLVIVAHRSAAELRQQWSGQSTALRSRVVCRVNSDDVETLNAAKSLFGNVRRIPNRGLSHGNNDGADAASAPFVLYLNPDVRVVEADLPRLEGHLLSEGGIVSPRLVGRDGVLQENARGWPNMAVQVANQLGWDHFAESYLWPLAPGTSGPVPWVLGASVAVKRSDVQRLGGWPEEYFLYYEDVELCLRAHRAGLPVWLLDDLRWEHAWQRSSRFPGSRAQRAHLRSALRFYSHHPEMVASPARLREIRAAGY